MMQLWLNGKRIDSIAMLREMFFTEDIIIQHQLCTELLSKVAAGIFIPWLERCYEARLRNSPNERAQDEAQGFLDLEKCYQDLKRESVLTNLSNKGVEALAKICNVDALTFQTATTMRQNVPANDKLFELLEVQDWYQKDTKVQKSIKAISPELIARRISAMLKCAAWFDYRAVVLGAWGCGAFRNDARVISDIFRKVLKEEVPFSRFDFAVLDRTKDQYNFNEFNRNFAYENFYADEIAKDTIAAVELKEKARRDKMAALDAIKKSEIHLDKVRGCILGGAAGDALGYPVEFMNEAQIYDKFGEDGITDYALDPETGKALISDDTQMTLFTATGCLYGDTRISLRGIGAAPHNYIMWHYEDWLMTQETSFEERQREFAKWESSVRCWHSWLADEPRLYKRRAPGRTCIQAMRCRFGHGSPPCPTKTTVNISKGCGGVMRVAPIGLFYIDPYRDMKMVASEGAEVAALTHGHSLGFMPAAMLAYIINRIVYPHAKLESKPLKGIILEAIDSVREIFAADKNINALVSIINLAIRLAESWEDERECIHEIGEGWVAEEALAIAIFCSLRHQDSFSAGIIAAANHKGDSDSTAAITGNILGALLGYSAIAEKWKTNLELSDVILEVSDDMCHGCVMDEYSSYYDDRWHDKYVEGRMPK